MSKDFKEQIEVNQLGQKLSGEIRLSLTDYHGLLSECYQARRQTERYQKSLVQVKRFLTMLSQKEGFSDVMQRFNSEVSNVKFTIDDSGQVSLGEVTGE